MVKMKFPKIVKIVTINVIIIIIASDQFAHSILLLLSF